MVSKQSWEIGHKRRQRSSFRCSGGPPLRTWGEPSISNPHKSILVCNRFQFVATADSRHQAFSTPMKGLLAPFMEIVSSVFVAAKPKPKICKFVSCWMCLDMVVIVDLTIDLDGVIWSLWWFSYSDSFGCYESVCVYFNSVWLNWFRCYDLIV